MPRSICVHPNHKPTIAAAFKRNGIHTQGQLASQLWIALSTVNNFCRGIKVSVSKFEQICEALGLDSSEITLPPEIPNSQTPKSLSPQTPSTLSYNIPFFAYDDFWVGRDQLTTDLLYKLTTHCRLLLLTGISGIGKTALSERLTLALHPPTPPTPQPPTLPFTHTLQENFDNPEQPTDFASFAARLLESCHQPVTPEERSQPSLLTRRLVTYLQSHPVLILVDSLEQILQGNPTEGWSEFQDDGYVRFFKAILASNQCPSRVIITSQDLPPELDEIGDRYANFWHCQPLKGLTPEEQQQLFDNTGFAGTDQSATDTLTRIGSAYEGHPLALRTILGEIGDSPFFGNVAAYWNRYGHEIEAVEKALAEAAAGQAVGTNDKWRLASFTRALRRKVQARLEHTLSRLRQDARYAYILLCETSVYRCPVPEEWWLSHLEDWASAPHSPQTDADFQATLDILRDRYLIEETPDGNHILLTQHNLIRSLTLTHLKNLTFEVSA